MRPIDADVLKDHIYLRWGCDPAYYKDPKAEEASRILEDLEECPTIEAIPISWIKSYVLSTGKAILPFNAMINEWRRINGQ